jgi:hypothetical protein
MVRIYSTVSGRLLHIRDTTGGEEEEGNTNSVGVDDNGIQGMTFVSMNCENDSSSTSSTSSSSPSPSRVGVTMAISDLQFSPTGRYVGVARRDGKTMILDGWGEWCRGTIMTPPCLNPFTMNVEGVFSFVRRPLLMRHSTPRDPHTQSATGMRNSTAESVPGTCAVVALGPTTLGLLTIVPSAATHHHHQQRKGIASNGDDFLRNTDVGAVEWNRGFERPRVLSEFKLDGSLRGIAIHPSQEYVVVLTSKGTLLIYHLWLGQLRGIIPTIASEIHRDIIDSKTTRANTFTMDPSGLYVAVVVPWYERPTLYNQNGESNHTTTINVVAQGNIVVFYEILTGAYAGRITRRWPIGAIQDVSWSPCGSRVAIATNIDHCASIYRLKHGMWDNVRNILQMENENNEFWAQHPIFLEPFRPTEEEEEEEDDDDEFDDIENEGVEEMVEVGSGRLSASASMASMSTALDKIISMEELSNTSNSGVVRTDRTGLSTARKRLSRMLVGNSIRAARLHVIKRILLPADNNG